MSGFAGEVVLVTGGSSGIGLATARLLAKAGARVYLVARHRDGLVQATEHIGAEVHPLVADVSDGADVAGVAETLQHSEGRLDVLVTCAGQLEVGPAEAAGAAAAERLLQVNYLGAVRTMEACLPLLRAGSRRSIVNVSSLAGRMAPPWMAAYAGSKFALTGYTLALRQELRAEGFHVGLVFAGPVATPMTEGVLGGRYYPLPPLVPVIEPERVARAIVRMVARRKGEITVPARLGPAARLLAAWPGLTDLVYRATTRSADGEGGKKEIS